MKLSIIVPVYNMAGDGKLQFCMESLVRQTITDYEIIAVDDKSTDDSLAILHEYEQSYPDKIKVIASAENKRQGGAKNLGLDAACGEWVGFIDSDDWISPEMFSKLLKKAEETGADVVGCDYTITDQIGKEEGRIEENNSADQVGILDEYKHRRLILGPGSMVIKIYKRELFERNHIRFPERMFYEDNAIGVLPLLYATHFERVKESLYYYYQHSASTVHTVNMDRLNDRVRAMKIYLDECKNRGFYTKYKDEIDYKVFELGYRNTLFSYLQNTKKAQLSYLVEMRKFLMQYVPDIDKNAYYMQYMDDENKKMISIHQKNSLIFLIYYKLLWTYRRVKYGNRTE